MNGEIARVRAVLAGWGYQFGRDDDTLLPMVACQLFLLNCSPHIAAIVSQRPEHGPGAGARSLTA